MDVIVNLAQPCEVMGTGMMSTKSSMHVGIGRLGMLKPEKIDIVGYYSGSLFE